MERHSSGTHVEDGDDKVNRTEDGGEAGEVKAEDPEINGGAGVRLNSAEGGIDGSSGTGTNLDEGGEEEES